VVRVVALMVVTGVGYINQQGQMPHVNYLPRLSVPEDRSLLVIILCSVYCIYFTCFQ